MKKSIIILFTLVATSMNAQENKLVPQISVSGEGKVKVAPDQVVINLGVQNTGKDAAEVKKMNDETVDKVVKYIKKFGIPTSDFQTTNVNLYKSYDYEKKKHNFQASQSITITLKDIKKYFDNVTYISYMTVEPSKDEINNYLKEIHTEILESSQSELWTIGRLTEFIKQDQHPNVKIFSSIQEMSNNL